MNGTLDVVTARIPAATIIPAKALFTRHGKPTIYAVAAEGFQPVGVEVLARNSDEVAVKGVDADAQVALVDPLVRRRRRAAAGAGASNDPANLALLALAGAIIAAGFGIGRGLRVTVATLAEPGDGSVPTTTVRRSDVAIEVSTRGELQGGGARPLIVPRAGVAELPITFLRSTGDLVDAGDVVAAFDPSGQQFDLREAEADLEEARQQQIKAEAEAFVALEKARLEVVTSEADVKVSAARPARQPVSGIGPAAEERDRVRAGAQSPRSGARGPGAS